jgi:tetratricopeptide (TPR) repeat protein
MSEPLTFVASGVRREGGLRGGPPIADRGIGIVKDSVLLTARRAADGGDVRVSAVPGEDAVVLHIAGGPALWLHPEHARDLLRAQQDPSQARGADDTALRPGEVRVPVRLQWRLEEANPARGAARGFLGDVLVQAIDVVTGLVTDKAADFAASAVVNQFDARVDPGVYELNPERLTSLKGQSAARVPASNGPSLVLIHGTFSETSGTFAKLWTEHPQLIRALFTAYGGRVYGLDHPTLGASPVANAITLAEAAEEGARLHLLTHSRGGLVAEVLARVAAQPADSSAAFTGNGNAAQSGELRRLAAIVSAKRLSVDRVVRVACPARGTLLASKRLDAYVSVAKWALELAGVPIAPQLLSFLGEVARRRADPDTLPGLAAQVPDSPLVQWLYGSEAAIAGDLRVVAGDLEGDSVVSWVKTLLSDAFYWSDNDLVVQTRSMYGGTPRRTSSTFVLDQGGKVSHFNYFSNGETATAIVDALTKEAPPGFRVIGPLSWSGESSYGLRAALVERSAAAAAALPALFVLPGILGSNLKVGDERVWLAWRLVNGFSRLAYDPGKNAVEPDGPIGMFYDELATSLSTDHEVIPFAFDWRVPIEEEAERLADAVDAALLARKDTGKPVRILAHSMGGIVARTLQLRRPETWKRMMRVDGARVLMLGAPNGGSYAPMQVLSGDDTFGNVLTTVGAPFRGDEIRQLIAQFPGLLQLQADLLGDLGREEKWKALADEDLDALRAQSIWHRLPLQLRQYIWGIPSQAVLDRAVKLRRDLDKQRETDLAAFAGKLLLVVGKAPFTPAGYDRTKEGLVYLNVAEQGDGRVTLQSALLPGVDTWTLDCDHGSLPKRREAFEAYRDLLNDGTTTRLARVSAAGASRGAVALPAALARSRPARAMFTVAPPQQETEVLAATGRAAPAVRTVPPGAALRVTVGNGDLTYITEPLLIGHYRSSKLTGAEAVMDRAIGHAMSASLARGLYPLAAGTHQVFTNVQQSAENPWQLPRPAAVIVAGLGAEGELRGTDLVLTVRQAVIAWGQRLMEQPSTLPTFTLATTLLGSGGQGVSAGQAAQLIAQGVREANEQLASDHKDAQRWPRVGHLRIIELYLDRAGEAWRSLQALAASSPAMYTVGPVIEEGIGSLRRPPDAGYRGVDYDFISALLQKVENDEERIVYSVDTRRARSEVRAQATQVPLIRNLVASASTTLNADSQIGRTLFNLVVPVDLEPFMGSSTATVIELDRGTAGIPWELLDNRTRGSGDDRPWAIRTKLLRKLRTSGTPGPVNDASADDSILVIGDPACDRKSFPRLYGARQEATAVVECLSAARDSEESVARSSVPHVLSLISPPDPNGPEPDANAIINATMSRPWRIIHIAGHGEPPRADRSRFDPRGVVLSGDSFLGPREIRALRVIPELVFVNCCYLATADVRALLTETNYDRAQFASGVAEALIRIGVRCVVAAGWAVDDEAARVFATTFYDQLLNGATFIDAVAAARTEARACGGNTWAAYQCYGDPDWRYRAGTGDAQRPTAPPPSQEFAGIASSAAIVLALETLAVKSEFQNAPAAEQAERLRYLEETFKHFWKDNGQVAAAFGNAWSKMGRFDEAIGWFERARTAPDGSAPLTALEQLANLKVRRAWQWATQPGIGAARARGEIADAMALLDSLLALGGTVERESLYGSAYKRLALIEAAGGRTKEEAESIAMMKEHYEAAERIARERIKDESAGPVNVLYPVMNRIAAQLALEGGTAAAKALDKDTIEMVRRSMLEAPPDFWSVVGQTELNMYASLSAGTLEGDVNTLTKEFQLHADKVNAVKSWGSVYDNATFVLSKYMARAKESEAKAARLLLQSLARLANREVPNEPIAPSADVSVESAPLHTPLAAGSTRARPRRSKGRASSRGRRKPR